LRSSAVARATGLSLSYSDPEKAVIVIENVYNAINQISQTTVRNVVGRFSLDQLLSDTASINLQIKNVIDGHTEPWGTQVTAVEIRRSRSIWENRETWSGVLSCRSVVGYSGGLRTIGINPEDDAC
jgi:hypothetical protein